MLLFPHGNGLGIRLAVFPGQPLQREAEDGNPAVPCERRNLNDRESPDRVAVCQYVAPVARCDGPYALAVVDDSVTAVGLNRWFGATTYHFAVLCHVMPPGVVSVRNCGA